MVAIYTNLGIPAAISVVVVLSYRIISFWLPSLAGFAISGYLQKKSAHTKHKKSIGYGANLLRILCHFDFINRAGGFH